MCIAAKKQVRQPIETRRLHRPPRRKGERRKTHIEMARVRQEEFTPLPDLYTLEREGLHL